MDAASVSTQRVRGPVDHDVRRQIVAAATDHFSRHGYDKTTVSELASDIGFSKAYVYKFFESKQAIGAMICANCLGKIDSQVAASVDAADSPPEKLRRMFATSVEATLELFSEDRKLYEIARSAAAERWAPVIQYEERQAARLQAILHEGRASGDFERKTPIDDAVAGIFLVMRPYLNPLLLQHGLDHAQAAPALLSSLILRSLAPCV